MRTFILAAAAAAVVTGCGSDAPERNAAASERAASLTPGEYELSWTVVDVTSTDQTTPATALKAGAPATTTRTCVAADGSIDPAAFAEGEDECTPNESYIKNGRMSLQLKCTRAGQTGNAMQGVDGDFTADGFEATVLGSTGFGGSGDYNMTRKVTATRVGDCPAGGAAADANAAG